MAQQDNTGGDGTTGMTGLQVRQAYDNNFDELYGAMITREFSRAWTQDLVFDKNDIFYAPKIMDDDIVFTIASGFSNNTGVAQMTIIADGVHSISFDPGINKQLSGITDGEVLEAGSYDFFMLYVNGKLWFTRFGGTSESSSLVQLTAPANFEAVADGQNEIDLEWDNVTNNAGYKIEVSLNGSTGWSEITTTAVDAVTYSHTGLTAGTSYWYRITALGDGVNFTNSNYSLASTATAGAGDVGAPVPTFLPLNTATDWAVNAPVTITFDEPIRNTDGSAVTDLNIASLVTLKQTNSGGTNIAFTATIDVTKTIVTITPTTHYGATQLVYVAINNFEDSTGNQQTSPQSITFTTGTFSKFTKLQNNRVVFGDILDSVFAGTDSQFRILVTLRNASLVGSQRFLVKTDAATLNTFAWYSIGSDIYFAYYCGPTSNNGQRFIKWAGALTTAEIDLDVRYDGSIDTNDGLDRCSLYVDGVLAGSKTLASSTNTLDDINNINTNLCFGIAVNAAGTPVQTNYYDGDAKDLLVQNLAGSVTHLNIPVLRTGTDTSGNVLNGTWV